MNNSSALIHSDSVIFNSEEELQRFTNAIGNEFIAKRNLDLTDKEIENASITDCAEMWRLYSWFHSNIEIDNTDEKRNQSLKKVSMLANAIIKKLSKIDEVYCLYHIETGEPFLFSQTLRQKKGYFCTPPDIRIFTKSHSKIAEEKYPHNTYKMVKIESGNDGKGIGNFLGKCFYLNGAKGVEVNGEGMAISGDMLISPPDFTGIDPLNIPVTNPALMRWMILISQLPQNKTEEEKIIFNIYYDFLSREIIKAKFLAPAKLSENVKEIDDSGRIQLNPNSEISFATVVNKASKDRSSILLYTDWKRMNERYDKTNAFITSIDDFINKHDVIINLTNYPKLGLHITPEIYNDMKNRNPIK